MSSSAPCSITGQVRLRTGARRTFAIALSLDRPTALDPFVVLLITGTMTTARAARGSSQDNGARRLPFAFSSAAWSFARRGSLHRSHHGLLFASGPRCTERASIGVRRSSSSHCEAAIGVTQYLTHCRALVELHVAARCRHDRRHQFHLKQSAHDASRYPTLEVELNHQLSRRRSGSTERPCGNYWVAVTTSTVRASHASAGQSSLADETSVEEILKMRSRPHRQSRGRLATPRRRNALASAAASEDSLMSSRLVTLRSVNDVLSLDENADAR